jgi:transcriptional regulator with XRE-family HTH domain
MLSHLTELARARAWLPEPEERKRIRIDAGLTVKALADYVGISVSAMNSLERAEHPGDKHLVKYVAALKALDGPSKSPQQSGLTPEEVTELRGRWEEHACGSCGGLHTTAVKAPGSCPRIKRIAYDAQGRMLEVEYWPEGKWPKDGIIWPDELVVEE